MSKKNVDKLAIQEMRESVLLDLRQLKIQASLISKDNTFAKYVFDRITEIEDMQKQVDVHINQNLDFIIKQSERVIEHVQDPRASFPAESKIFITDQVSESIWDASDIKEVPPEFQTVGLASFSEQSDIVTRIMEHKAANKLD